MAQTTPLLIHWGRRIRAARQDQGLTVNGLARQAGIDPGNLSRVERGMQGTSDDMRMRIAGALGRRVEDLFGYPDTTDQRDDPDEPASTPIIRTAS